MSCLERWKGICELSWDYLAAPLEAAGSNRSWARRLKSWAEGRFEKVDTVRNQNVRAFRLGRDISFLGSFLLKSDLGDRVHS